MAVGCYVPGDSPIRRDAESDLCPLQPAAGGLEPDMALLVAVSGGLVYMPGGAAVLGFTAGLLQETLAGVSSALGPSQKG